MNPGRFYMPGYMGMRSGSISAPLMRMANSAPRSIGLFSRITNSIRSINWGGLLNNTSKTLNVVNQAIPLVRQAGPMVNNMKSMLRIAKAFGSETTSSSSRRGGSHPVTSNSSNLHNNPSSGTNNYSNKKDVPQKKEAQNDNAPNFFI